MGAVVVGFDRHFNYYKIQYAQLAINEHGVSRRGSVGRGSMRVCLCLLFENTGPWPMLTTPAVASVACSVVQVGSAFHAYELAHVGCVVWVQAEFIATNLDAVTHLTDAQEWAGNGSMVGAIKGT